MANAQKGSLEPSRLEVRPGKASQARRGALDGRSGRNQNSYPFKDPFWEATFARPNTVTVIHVELDSPAPYLGCKVEITLEKGGTSAWGKDKQGEAIVKFLSVPC